jgi:hypothetical protein
MKWITTTKFSSYSVFKKAFPQEQENMKSLSDGDK